MPPPLHPPQRPYPGYPAYPEHPLESARKCLFWGWCVVGGGCVLALIPFLGILAWFITGPLVLTGFVLAIISIAKGRTVGGIFLLLFSIFVAPITLFVGPIVSSLLGAASIAPQFPPSNSLEKFGPSAPYAPTTEAEMAAERESIQRQLESKSVLRR
ncbi:MAG: hypothetical protein V4689_19615 [Verrucomicrobiota bacterium]